MAQDARGTPLWEVELGPERPPLQGTVHTDVCVVGLGGSGLSCVRELRRLGTSVVGVEAGRVGWGAAGRNGGFLLAGLAPFYHDAVERYGRERARAMYALTMEELDRIATETPVGVSRHGSPIRRALAASPSALISAPSDRGRQKVDSAIHLPEGEI